MTDAGETPFLALDDRTGAIKPLPEEALRYALTGAFLMQQAMANPFDTDPDGLHPIDPTPPGDPLLDEVPSRVSANETPEPSMDRQNAPAREISDLQAWILDRLVSKGVLRIEDRLILRVFAARRHPMQDDREVKEVGTRLRALIDGNEIPDPDEAALIASVYACRWFDGLSTEEESSRLRPRIDRWITLDSIGREVAPSVDEISRAMAGAMPTIMERRRMRNRPSAPRWRRASLFSRVRERPDRKVVA